MEIIKVVPRGYCQGVVRAIQIAEKTVKENPGQKVYMLGMIVHNRHVVEHCESLGIICLEKKGASRMELLDEIPEGIVIFTAHGVSDEVYRKAEHKGLRVVDATCADVMKTHDLVRSHCSKGDVIYIGKKDHPEAEGTAGISKRVHLVTCAQDIEKLGPLSNVLITCQTTLSMLDTKELVDLCLAKYPDAKTAPEICSATTMRQKAVLNLKDVDALFVVGDPHSNNSNQLREIGKKAGIPHSYLLEDASMLKPEMLHDVKRAAVTSGSSTPTELTNAVIAKLESFSL